MTRRFILILLALLGVILLVRRRIVLRQFFARTAGRASPRIPPERFSRNGKSVVAVSGSGGPAEMIREAVGLLGGFGRLDLRGRSVLVKPNVVSGRSHPTTTSSAVVAAMVEVLYEEGAGKVYVGDMSAAMHLNTIRNMGENGIREAAESAGAEVVGFEDHGWVEVDLPRSSIVGKASVTEWLYKVDRVVNLPVIKTHRSAGFSICLKNFIGCTHLRQRPYLIDPSHWEEIIAEFNLAWRADLNIVDGTVSMIEGGPWQGTPAETGVIIASEDPVAADAIGLGIIRSFGRWEPVVGREVWEQRQIIRALDLGLGRGPGDILLLAGRGDAAFEDLLVKVRDQTGLDRG